MKFIFCTDLMLDGVCMDINDMTLLKKWRDMRLEKFSKMISDFSNDEGVNFIFTGKFFGNEMVRNSVVDLIFDCVRKANNDNFFVFLENFECKFISFRQDIPSNFHYFVTDVDNCYKINDCNVKIKDSFVEFLINDKKIFDVSDLEMNSNVSYYDKDSNKVSFEIRNFEPLGFDNFSNKFGDCVLEFDDDGNFVNYNDEENLLFSFGIVRVVLGTNDNNITALNKIIDSVRDFKYETVVKVILSGEVAVDFSLDIDNCYEALKYKVFFADISNCTRYFINRDELEEEITLRNEFIFSVLEDDSLSDKDRQSVLECGFNALSWKEE